MMAMSCMTGGGHGMMRKQTDTVIQTSPMQARASPSSARVFNHILLCLNLFDWQYHAFVVMTALCD